MYLLRPSVIKQHKPNQIKPVFNKNPIYIFCKVGIYFEKIAFLLNNEILMCKHIYSGLVIILSKLM